MCRVIPGAISANKTVETWALPFLFCRTRTLRCPYLWVLSQDRGRIQAQNCVENLLPSTGELQCTCPTDQLRSRPRWIRIWFCTLWCIWVIRQRLWASMPVSSPFSPKSLDNWPLFFSFLTCCADQVQLRLSNRWFRRDFRLLIRHHRKPILLQPPSCCPDCPLGILYHSGLD